MNKNEIENTVHVLDELFRAIYGNDYQLYGSSDERYRDLFNGIFLMLKGVLPEIVYLVGRHGDAKIKDLNESYRQILRATVILYFGQDHATLETAFKVIDNINIRHVGSSLAD